MDEVVEIVNEKKTYTKAWWGIAAVISLILLVITILNGSSSHSILFLIYTIYNGWYYFKQPADRLRSVTVTEDALVFLHTQSPPLKLLKSEVQHTELRVQSFYIFYRQENNELQHIFCRQKDFDAKSWTRLRQLTDSLTSSKIE